MRVIILPLAEVDLEKYTLFMLKRVLWLQRRCIIQFWTK